MCCGKHKPPHTKVNRGGHNTEQMHPLELQIKRPVSLWRPLPAPLLPHQERHLAKPANSNRDSGSSSLAYSTLPLLTHQRSCLASLAHSTSASNFEVKILTSFSDNGGFLKWCSDLFPSLQHRLNSPVFLVFLTLPSFLVPSVLLLCHAKLVQSTTLNRLFPKYWAFGHKSPMQTKDTSFSVCPLF